MLENGLNEDTDVTLNGRKTAIELTLAICLLCGVVLFVHSNFSASKWNSVIIGAIFDISDLWAGLIFIFTGLFLQSLTSRDKKGYLVKFFKFAGVTSLLLGSVLFLHGLFSSELFSATRWNSLIIGNIFNISDTVVGLILMSFLPIMVVPIYEWLVPSPDSTDKKGNILSFFALIGGVCFLPGVVLFLHGLFPSGIFSSSSRWNGVIIGAILDISDVLASVVFIIIGLFLLFLRSVSKRSKMWRKFS